MMTKTDTPPTAEEKRRATTLANVHMGLAEAFAAATLKHLPLSTLWIDRKRNPRGEEDFKRVPELADSIRQTGIRNPLVGVPLANPKGEEDILIVQGDRRTTAGHLIVDGDPDNLGAFNPENVPVLIVPTTEKRLIDRLYVDVDQTVIPSSWRSESNIVRKLLNSGMTENAVAASLGWSRGKVQHRKRLYQMPKETRESIFAFLVAKANGAETLKEYQGIKYTTKAFHRLTKAWNLENADDNAKNRKAKAEAEADGNDWPTLWDATKRTLGANFEAEANAESKFLSPEKLTELRKEISGSVDDNNRAQMTAFLLLLDVVKKVDGAKTEFADTFLS